MPLPYAPREVAGTEVPLEVNAGIDGGGKAPFMGRVKASGLNFG